MRIVKEKSGIQGRVTMTNYLLDSEKLLRLDNFLKNAQGAEFKKGFETLKRLCTGVRQEQWSNQVVLSGREVFARLIVDDTTYTGEITHGALGSGSTAITDGDTTLDTEVARKPFADRTRNTDSIQLDFYYSKSDTNGTYEEFGAFIDGTDTVDSGQMFNRVLTGGWTKSASEAMTVTFQIDINAA